MKRLFPPAILPLVICVLLSLAPLRVSAQEGAGAGGAAPGGAAGSGTSGGNGAGTGNAAAAGETGAGEEAAAQEAAGETTEGADGENSGTEAGTGAEGGTVTPEEAAGNAELNYIEMDINTSTLTELAAWCREVGLNDGGSRQELASRLRDHYNVTASRRASGQRVITIESAKTTEYFTIDVVDEEYARLKGNVIISLKDGNAAHRIKAWEILYNRTRNVMTATGDVEYTKEEGDSVETFKGDTITVNLDNWSSIFMDGASEKSASGATAAYRFAGTIISHNDEDVTLLTGATITNPADPEAFWSLHASKLWLLPGNDWAFLNAVLKVGNIPVLYIPAFFYPADEIVFHPVLGYRTREGTFLQTTTYILGRPKSSSTTENSLTKIFGGDSDNSPKVREGVFLRTSGEKRYEPNDIRLSLLFDAYANLGAYLGSELTLPGKAPFGETTVSAGLGLTRDIYTVNGNYTPFPEYNGESVWNSGRLFSFSIPFRYRFKINGSYSINSGSLSWEVPYYSDPYVDRDFMRRSETLDWLGMLREGTSAGAIDETYLSSYEWKLNGSFNPPIRDLNPYVNSFSISSITSTLLFNQRLSGNYSGPSAPPNAGRAFFFPDRFTIFSVTASASGTPFKSGSAPAAAEEAAEVETEPGDSLLPDLPLPPWESAGTRGVTSTTLSDGYNFAPPVLDQKFTFPSAGGPEFSVNYRLTPTAASELQFRSTAANWSEPEDINWGEISTLLTRLRSDGNIDFNVTHSGGGAYSGAVRLFATGSFQNYIYLNESAEEFSSAASVKAARDRAYNETYLNSSLDLSGTVRPFYQNPVWSGTSIQYALRGLLAKTTVDTTGSDPDWNWDFGGWEASDIESHQITANIAANVMDYNQNFSVSAVLPPEDASVSGSATFRAWISETSLRGRVLFPLDTELRKIEPLYLTETLRFSTNGSFQQYIVFDPEVSGYTTFTSSLSYLGLAASFSAVYAQPYEYNHNGSVDNSQPNGWIQMPDKGLHPNQMRLDYRNTFAQNNLWDKRLSFSLTLNTGISFDLQRYTNSKFTFSLGAKLGITRFLDLNLSTSSENAVIFKYFQGLPFFNMPSQLYPGQETNLFMDLVNSFRFDSDDLRRRSGFKLKTLNLSLVHHLGDWDATLTIKTTPYMPSGSRNYVFNNEISFLVQWKPIGEIRTQIDYSRDVLTVK